MIFSQMLTPLSHFAEPYAAQGNIDARAATKAIGRPQLDQWDVFLRETLQNSWDARMQASGGLTYCVDGFWPTNTQVELLRGTVFKESLPESPLHEFLDAPLDAQPVLVVTDLGSKGLGGPTRADLVSSESADFVDFVRNIGRAADKQLGGGTYGFGKGILWQVSGCSTVLVYTKTTFRGRPVSRFMAIGHTDSYAVDGKRFTGRHWWGRRDPVTLIEPVEGPDADALAVALGMDRLQSHTTGTALMVLEPQGSEAAETMDEIIARVAQAALWWAWPHIVDRTINFQFTSQGRPVAVPSPDEHPVLSHFADAYRRTSRMEHSAEEWPWNREVLRMQRPMLRLGSLVWRRVGAEGLTHDEDDPVEISSHVALMRKPRFIVKYLPVRPDPAGMATVGVFVADGDLNDDFAKAEPVAHDDWSPGNMGLPKGTRNPVRKALDELKHVFTSAAVIVPVVGPSSGNRAGLVHLSTSIGDLVTGSGDASVQRPRPSGGGGASGNKLRAKVAGRPTLRMRDGARLAAFVIEVHVPESVIGPVRLTATPHVLTESGRDDSEELESSSVRSWPDLPQGFRVTRQGLMVEAKGRHHVTCEVSVPPDSAVGVSVAVHEDESGAAG